MYSKVKYELSFTVTKDQFYHYLVYIMNDKLIIIEILGHKKGVSRRALILKLKNKFLGVDGVKSDVFVDYVYKTVIMNINLREEKVSKIYLWKFDDIFDLFSTYY